MHLAYLLRLEAALQKKVPGVMMPYWNEIDDGTCRSGLPDIFPTEDYVFARGERFPTLFAPTHSKRQSMTVCSPSLMPTTRSRPGSSRAGFPFPASGARRMQQPQKPTINNRARMDLI